MPRETESAPFRSSIWPIRVGIAAIVLLFALLGIVGLLRAQRGQAATQQTFDDTLTRIELVSRIQRDLDRKRLLIDEHIFEPKAADMARLEAQMAELDADFGVAAAEVASKHAAHLDRKAWELLRASVADLSEPTARVLAASRVNHDVEALADMGTLDPRFEELDRVAERLIVSTRAAADEASRMLREEQAQNQGTRVATMVAGILLTLAIGVWVSRLVARREAQLFTLLQWLEDKNRELDAFASRVAHDLRGPLSSMTLAAARLETRATAEDKASAVLVRGCVRMDVLIKDLLALSRVDAEATTTQTCDPHDVASSVVDDLRARVDEHHGTLVFDVAAGIVRCSEALLRQALWNLVDNAVKYRKKDVPPKIEIHGTASDTMYTLAVADNGIGLSPEDARHVFEPFFRAGVKQEAPGTGLGLSIVKRVIEASGGSVSVAPSAEAGTAFTLRLSLAN
jgi:signal transduction histidine kinase